MLGTGELVDDFKLLSISIETLGECGDDILRCFASRKGWRGLGQSRLRSGKLDGNFFDPVPAKDLRGGRGLSSGTSWDFEGPLEPIKQRQIMRVNKAGITIDNPENYWVYWWVVGNEIEDWGKIDFWAIMAIRRRKLPWTWKILRKPQVQFWAGGSWTIHSIPDHTILSKATKTLQLLPYLKQ